MYASFFFFFFTKNVFCLNAAKNMAAKDNFVSDWLKFSENISPRDF